jgi:hypothetical protein
MDDKLYGIEKSCKDFGERVLNGCFWTGIGLTFVFGGLTYLAFSDCDCEKVEEGYGVEEGVGYETTSLSRTAYASPLR